MARVPMGGKDVLPPGPQRDLVTAVYDLYERAGKPSLRDIATWIRKDDRLTGTLSHEGVRAAITGSGATPRWQNLEALVRVLAGRDVHQGSVDDAVVRLHTLWIGATEPTRPVVSPPTVVQPPSPPTLQQAIALHGQQALVELLAVTLWFSELSQDGISAVAQQLDESTEELVSYIAERDFGEALDEALPVEDWDDSVSLIVATAAFRPSSEIVDFLAGKWGAPSGESLTLCLLCLAVRYLVSSADEIIRLFLGLDRAGVDYDKDGLLQFYGGMLQPEQLVPLLVQMSTFDLAYDVTLLCRGVCLRSLTATCEILNWLKGKEGSWARHTVIRQYVGRRGVDGTLRLMAAFEEQGDCELIQEVASEVAAAEPCKVLEFCEAAKKAARPASLDRVLGEAAKRQTPFVADFLIGLAERNLHDEQATLLSYARKARREGLSTVAHFLDFVEVDETLKEKVRAAIEASAAAQERAPHQEENPRRSRARPKASAKIVE